MNRWWRPYIPFSGSPWFANDCPQESRVYHLIFIQRPRLPKHFYQSLLFQREYFKYVYCTICIRPSCVSRICSGTWPKFIFNVLDMRRANRIRIRNVLLFYPKFDQYYILHYSHFRRLLLIFKTTSIRFLNVTPFPKSLLIKLVLWGRGLIVGVVCFTIGVLKNGRKNGKYSAFYSIFFFFLS